MLRGKEVVLGVTGGIAAYKAVEIVSRLRKAGAKVHVIMTKSATEFVTELTFREISGNPVAQDMWAPVQQWNVEHIALAKLADLFLLAPATANVLAKAACGIADDLLTTTLLATKAPVFFAPAMNSAMYENVVTQENIAKLKQRGWQEIAPESGVLACGTSGVGRLAEPVKIVEFLQDYLQQEKSLAGKKVLVTAGGTREPLDPVRFLGNRSSGKMGFAVAEEAARRGADVVLVTGPTSLQASPGIRRIDVETTREMYRAVVEEFADSDITVKAAAVADYRPQQTAEQKIKKDGSTLTLVLEKTEDILFELGQRKKAAQLLIGFAAETENLLANAQKKISKKNLDMIVANNVTVLGAGFGSDNNLVKFIYPQGEIEELPMMSKAEVAKAIFARAEELLEK